MTKAKVGVKILLQLNITFIFGGKFMKKVIATLLASAMVFSALGGLVACGGDDGDDKNTLVVWAPQAAIAGYESLVAGWKEANPDYAGLNVIFTAVDEGEAETKLNTDAGKGADVFFFEAGQINGLQEKNLLQGLGATVTAEIKARDLEADYNPILTNGVAMAFPTTADNGYFLWYDNTVISDEQAETLDGILAAAKAADKNVMFDYANGWYLPSFWFGAGLKMDYEGDTYVTDIDSAKGQEVAKAVNKYLGPTDNKLSGNNKACIIKHASNFNTEIGDGFASGTVAAGIIGTWVADDIQKKMASATRVDGATYDDIKCAKLPTYTLGNEQVQMGSFMGDKYCGVNAQKKTGNIEASISLANYFTNENGQRVRFEKTQAAPTNRNLRESEAVTANKAIVAVYEQNKEGGYLQLQQSSNFWTSWETFGNGLYKGTAAGATLADADVLTALTTLATTIKT